MFSCRLTLPCGRAKVCRGLFLCPHAGFPRVPMQRDPRGCKMPLKCLLRASINCQAGLSSSRQEQMNQTLNGKIKPLKVLKTTQLQRAPLCRTGSPSEREREGFFKPNWDFSGGLPPASPRHISWLPASPKGKFYPASRGLGCQVGKKNPICFQSGSSLPSTQPFSSPRSPAPSPQSWRVRQAGLRDAFFFFPPSLFFFSTYFFFFFF